MRIKGLDFLRGIAIILVLFRHSQQTSSNLFFFGWLGVDLFFVLSGFLVSGLLFQEYIKNEKVNLKRFLIRRGFKIYPPFYFFVFASLCIPILAQDVHYNMTLLRNELLYLQSYLPRIWLHTWSLAVEEHFYICMAIFIFISVKWKLLRKKNGIIFFLLALLVLSFNMRLNLSNFHRHENFGFMETHLRSDGIVIGVLMSYLYYFTDWVRPVFNNYKIYLLLSFFLILPGFQFEGGTFFMNTFGLTYVNFGFGLLVLLSLKFDGFLQNKKLIILERLFKIICFIGLHSYSIYLWHFSLKTILYNHLDYDENIMTFLYFLITIICGILFSLIIEKPFLRLRETKWVKRNLN